ncbi:Aminotransferase [Sphingomonas paucimobilis]|nr:Aminotransferase [Sphingomonas paucimobilis]
MTLENDLLERRYRTLGRSSPLFYDRPLHLVRGEGAWVWDNEGQRYLDAYNNVPHVGHCHPHVVDALCRQASRLNIHTRYLHGSIVAYAERLLATFDAPLSRTLFCCTGTEANELALRIARTATGGTGVIVTDYSYHGNSQALAEVTTGLPVSEPFAAHARAIALPDPYHRAPGMSAEDQVAAHVDQFRQMLASFHDNGVKPAALLFDTIFSTEGLIDVPVDYVRQIVDLTREAGALVIADEVQPGFGRMGDHFWGYKRYGIVPDIVTLGKPMGNGHPVSAVVTRPDLADPFGEQSLYFNTFAGNPVSAEVAAAVLDVIEQEGLIDRAAVTGNHLQDGLRHLAGRHAAIGDVRGRGLFTAIELVANRESKAPHPAAGAIVNAMRDEGVLMSRTGPANNVLKIRPPLAFGIDEAEILLTALDAVLTRVGHRNV